MRGPTNSVELGSAPHERELSGASLDELPGNRLLLSGAKTVGISAQPRASAWRQATVRRELPCLDENLSPLWRWV